MLSPAEKVSSQLLLASAGEGARRASRGGRHLLLLSLSLLARRRALSSWLGMISLTSGRRQDVADDNESKNNDADDGDGKDNERRM